MLQDFLNELKINGRGKQSIYLYNHALTEANNYKPLNEWNKNDASSFILYLQEKKSRFNKNYKVGTIEQFKLMVRKYFRWVGKPEIVAHLKVKLPKNNLSRDDILTVEDVNKLIDTTMSPMYKAYVATLFESGGREGEILAVKLEDIEETDRGIIMSLIQTKTGKDRRRVLLPFATQFIRNHIAYRGLMKGDYLFPGRVKGEALSHTQSWRMLKQIAKKAGIDKPMSAHKFRHAQATDMVLRNYQESVIRKKLGWTGDSRMIARYEHIVDDDVINATAEMAGVDVPRKPMAMIRQPDVSEIANAAMQKLSDENSELKKGYDELKKQMELIQAAMQAKQKS
jgi:integrase/recombinase XerD